VGEIVMIVKVTDNQLLLEDNGNTSLSITGKSDISKLVSK